MGVIVSVCVSTYCCSNQGSPEPKADLDVVFQGDIDIVSVCVMADKVRFFGFSSRQRTTRTRGKGTRYRKMDFGRSRSGSLELWCLRGPRSRRRKDLVRVQGHLGMEAIAERWPFLGEALS